MTLKKFLTLEDETLLERRKSDTGSYSWSYEIAASWALEIFSAATTGKFGYTPFWIWTRLDLDQLVD
jgi:hypothetical protein